MIKKLAIKNFKSHEETFLEFHEGVNIIVGNPQTGKTNIIRALEKVFTNKPGGFGFLYKRAEKPETEISVELDNCSVTYFKDDKKTFYKLNKEEPYAGFGTDVPDRVAEALNISELNIQEQLDIPFLITSPPGEVAKVINRITKLEDADIWQTELTSRVNSTNKDISKLNADINDTKAALNLYDNLDIIEALVEKIELTNATLTSEIVKKERLFELLIEISHIKKIIPDKNLVASLKLYVKKIDSTQESLITTEKSRTELNRLLTEIKDAKLLIKKINFKKEQFYVQLDILKFTEERDQLTGDIAAIQESRIFIKETQTLRNKLKEDLIQAYTELKKCPLCFSDISAKQIKKIAKEL